MGWLNERDLTFEGLSNVDQYGRIHVAQHIAKYQGIDIAGGFQHGLNIWLPGPLQKRPMTSQLIQGQPS